MPIGPFNDDQI